MQMLSWDLDKRLKPLIQFLIDCRPHSISMGKAIKVMRVTRRPFSSELTYHLPQYLRNLIAHVPPSTSEQDAKSHLIEMIDTFIQVG
jgi:translation initiation factor eIF-2B subunit delta